MSLTYGQKPAGADILKQHPYYIHTQEKEGLHHLLITFSIVAFETLTIGEKKYFAMIFSFGKRHAISDT